MKVVAIIQARLGSTRLPGKIMRKIGDLALFQIVHARTSAAHLVDDVVFATTNGAGDDVFCDALDQLGIKYFRGSEDDVLLRYTQAAEAHCADIIVRITCDDPFKDPSIIDECLVPVLDESVVFSTNVLSRSFAEGMDVECFSYALLCEMNKQAQQKYQREHITQYFYANMSLFAYYSLSDFEDMSSYRLTIDDEFDLNAITEVYREVNFDYSVDYKKIKKIISMPKFRRLLVGRIPAYAGLLKSKGK